MNSEIFSQEFLLTRVDFDREQKPRLKFANPATREILNWQPQFEENITLEINLTQRFCCGWHSLETGEDFVCPDNCQLDKKYDTCQKCQARTGFNPAFYNAAESDISQQQIERNLQPHFVYLAYFTDEMIKVGISFAGRGMARLLEQGARVALILGEFSSANIARNYEEKISKISGFCENVKAGAKLKALEKPFNFEKAAQTLLVAQQNIEQILNTKFENNSPIALDKFYSQTGEIPHGEMILAQDLPQNSDQKLIFSGKLKAQVGYILIAEQQGELITIPLRKFTGYKIRILLELTMLELPERQASLFGF